MRISASILFHESVDMNINLAALTSALDHGKWRGVQDVVDNQE